MDSDTTVYDRNVLEPERHQITAVGRSRWAQLEAAGLAPRRRALGRRAAWLLSELVDWCRAQPVGGPAAPRRALEARRAARDEAADAAAPARG
jgi:predicted DNA-binding transcriptional regulator AlpA